ncbi:MAG: hypothetical protein A2W99_06130 [Bacteroidetes bacterium GWF2_33_16]|nr:MAG: hypothetical protein A2X00_12765 [Bacteroidetes bacterium GWE2_32_14]OFY05260.1 MAG: hypothetical protein A2W99_06130 [Bacteroidetes bacterium GWF2_33_16]
MKNKFLILLFCFGFISISRANDPNFGILPENLKQDANAIIRYYDVDVTMISKNIFTKTVKYAITILNSNADDLAHLTFYYDNTNVLGMIHGKIFDKNGKLMRKIKAEEIKDRSYFSDGTVLGDGRLKYVEIYNNTYPYTVVFEYSLTYNGFVSLPDWTPVWGYNVAVEKSQYKFKASADYKFHYKEINLPSEPLVSKSGSSIIYRWNIENVNAIKKEPFSKGLYTLYPKLYISPDNFWFDGYDGNLENWSSFGYWIDFLLKGRDIISEQTQQKVQQIISESPTDFEKAKRIYEYMQSKTRYVSIQLGIGGFQPFTALEVDKTGFGDCKALTNYTKALLDYAGITSYYAIINGGDYAKEIITDYVSVDQMNHVILCIPFENDTVWAECTSQHIPFGYLGLFTDNRYAVIVTPQGGKLVKTTKYGIEENTQIRKTNVDLNLNGEINAKTETHYRGLQYDYISDQLISKKQDQKDELLKNLKFNNFVLNDFSYTNNKSRYPEAIENIDITVKNYISYAGNRILLPLLIFDQQSYIPPKVNNRKSDVLIRFSYIDIDTILYNVPEKFTVEFLPEPVKIESKFGKYYSEVKTENNKIIYIRKVEKYEGTYKPESYEELISFYKQMVKADNQKAVLIKKE